MSEEQAKVEMKLGDIASLVMSFSSKDEMLAAIQELKSAKATHDQDLANIEAARMAAESMIAQAGSLSDELNARKSDIEKGEAEVQALWKEFEAEKARVYAKEKAADDFYADTQAKLAQVERMIQLFEKDKLDNAATVAKAIEAKNLVMAKLAEVKKVLEGA